jgi:hypothetical protein
MNKYVESGYKTPLITISKENRNFLLKRDEICEKNKTEYGAKKRNILKKRHTNISSTAIVPFVVQRVEKRNCD